jgi:hypothetical protein
MSHVHTIHDESSVEQSMTNDTTSIETTTTAGFTGPGDSAAAATTQGPRSDLANETDDSGSRIRAIRTVQLRRMARVFGDLGLTSIVGRSWMQAGDEGFVFGGLDDRRFDLLLRALEDLASGVGPSPWVSTAGQLAFPSLDVPGPVWPSAPAASIHMVVPR